MNGDLFKMRYDALSPLLIGVQTVLVDDVVVLGQSACVELPGGCPVTASFLSDDRIAVRGLWRVSPELSIDGTSSCGGLTKHGLQIEQKVPPSKRNFLSSLFRNSAQVGSVTMTQADRMKLVLTSSCAANVISFISLHVELDGFDSGMSDEQLVAELDALCGGEQLMERALSCIGQDAQMVLHALKSPVFKQPAESVRYAMR